MKICPECKYRRTAKDNRLFPDYECPACGIIFEKDKARKALAELEEQRQIERKAKQEKIKKERELKIRQEQERLKREELERKAKEEAERQKQLEAERMRREEEELKRKQEEERLKKEEQERKAKEEAERQKQLEAERMRREEEERKHKQEEERLRKAEEEKKRQAELDRILLNQRKEKIEQAAKENPDTIISSTDTDKTYLLFDMCPFGMATSGKGISIVGFGDTKNKGVHTRCIQKFCRLWTWKIAENGEVYAQGCSLQFLGLSKEEITRNFSIKNKQILEEAYQLTDENNSTGSQE